MALAKLNPSKLNIKPLPPSALADKYPDGINVQFNPNSVTIGKAVTWSPPTTSSGTSTESNRKLNAPELTFNGGGARTLGLQLFFDVTEGGPSADVRTQTNLIVQLTQIERDLDEPPHVQVTWGTRSPPGSDFPFTGAITNLSQTFTLFRSTGEPLRANLSVTITELINGERDKKQTDPDFTTYRVKLGDSLASIAAKLYRDPTKWRAIADVNHIDDPRRLTVGTRLAIPKLG